MKKTITILLLLFKTCTPAFSQDFKNGVKDYEDKTQGIYAGFSATIGGTVNRIDGKLRTDGKSVKFDAIAGYKTYSNILIELHGSYDLGDVEAGIYAGISTSQNHLLRYEILAGRTFTYFEIQQRLFIGQLGLLTSLNSNKIVSIGIVLHAPFKAVY